MTTEQKLEIAHFTDPLCFWCYAMEPEMRKIRVLLEGQLEYRMIVCRKVVSRAALNG